MIIVPAAGNGERFKAAGYKTPKHELAINGKTMVENVIENVQPLDPYGKAFVATKSEVGTTKGAVHTVLKAFKKFGGELDEPLVIANCDQLVKLPKTIGMPGNGLVFTFRSSNPAHSYVVIDPKDRIHSICEKPQKPPSDHAVAGVYYFPQADPFIVACEMVHNNPHGEEYISEALDVMLSCDYALYAMQAPTAILGTPEDFQRFETAMQFAPGCECACAC